MTEQESPLEHIVQHPLIERPARVTPLTPNGTISVTTNLDVADGLHLRDHRQTHGRHGP